MKYLYIVLLAVVFLVGCQEQDKIESYSLNKNGVNVQIEGQNNFPKFLVGKWKATDKSGWEIDFLADGTIKEIVLPLGKFRIEPGKKTIIPMRMHKKSVIQPGQWAVGYIADDNELSVEIIIDKFYAELGNDSVEGNSKHFLTGELSKDKRHWYTDWVCFRKCTGHTAQNPNFDLSTDPIYGDSQKVTFEKVSK